MAPEMISKTLMDTLHIFHKLLSRIEEPHRRLCCSHYYYYYSLIRAFHISDSRLFFTEVSDSKSPQVSRILLSILAVLNNALVWMVSIRPPTAKSSSPFSNPLVTVPNAPITIGIIVTCMFHYLLIRVFTSA